MVGKSPKSSALEIGRDRTNEKGQAAVSNLTLSALVGEGGLEPPRPEGHWHLKPARLPFRHSPVATGVPVGMSSNWVCPATGRR